MKLFGKAKKAPPPSESIEKLRKTVEMLEKREAYLEKRIEQEVSVARANSTTNKKKAMMALRRKKLMESQIDKLSGARLNLETQMMYLEGATVDKATFDAMRGAASALQGIQKDISVDQVDRAMDDIQESFDVQRELGDALSQGFSSDLYDEDELENELRELEMETSSATALAMPSVPSTGTFSL